MSIENHENILIINIKDLDFPGCRRTEKYNITLTCGNVKV
jgi:hypothetical protein